MTSLFGRVRARLREARRDDDRGTAVVEFVAASVLLLVPVLYLAVERVRGRGARGGRRGRRVAVAAG